MRQLRIRLFGPASYAWDDGPERFVTGQRAALVLAYLALAPEHCASRKQLNDGLWGTGGDNARKAVALVRDRYPDLGVEESGGVRLTAPDVWVDVLRFKQSVDRRRFEEALDLAPRPLLEPLSDTVSLWLRESRRDLHAQVAGACRELSVVSSTLLAAG